jgi:hypothetical protein
MAIDYPDIISEYMDASKRYETDGVQIFPYLEPALTASKSSLIWSRRRSRLAGCASWPCSFRARLTFRSKSP